MNQTPPQTFSFNGNSGGGRGHRHSVSGLPTSGMEITASHHPMAASQMADMPPFPGHMHRVSAPNSTINLSRSPPNNKNTSHVPCKFFRLGNCQAGSACPFSHNLEAPLETQPCKYFVKGNCKFGHKCALAHVLPDGRRVNKHAFGNMHFSGLGGRGRMATYPDQLSQLPFAGTVGIEGSNLQALQHTQLNDSNGYKYLDGLQPFDTGYSSPPGSTYGSPRGEGFQHLSPSIRAIDAPLPSSFDSQGISYYAKYGHIANSVPATHGFPLYAASNVASTGQGTQFGNLDSLARNSSQAYESNRLGSSPPAGTEENPPKRAMHSERRSKPQVISASVGARPIMRLGHDDDSGDNTDEDILLLPDSLNDLLTPQEKMRRFSRSEEDGGPAIRRSFSGMGSPSDSKSGSPLNAASASRYGALFSRKTRTEESESGFGHVGSPLRNSSLLSNNSPSMHSASRPRSGDASPFGMHSPPNQRSGVGMLSQQLRTMRVTAADGASALGLVGRAASNSTMPISALGASPATSRLDRAVSSTSIGRSERIDEEHEPYLFEMEEEPTRERERRRDAQNRLSGAWNTASNPSSKSSPRVGAIGEPRSSSEVT